MIRAVLVDDEPPARVRMRQLLDAVGDVTVVGEAGSAARSARGDSRDAAGSAVPRRRDAGDARHGARGVAARAAAVHRVCDGVRQLRARGDRRRCHRLPAEAGVAHQAGGHARSGARAARLAQPVDATSSRRPKCSRTCGRDRCRRSRASIAPRRHCRPAASAAISTICFPIGRVLRDVGAAARRRLRQGRRGRPRRIRGAGARQHRCATGASRSGGTDGRRRSRCLRDRPTARATRPRSTACSMRSSSRLTLVNAGHPAALVVIADVRRTLDGHRSGTGPDRSGHLWLACGHTDAGHHARCVH